MFNKTSRAMARVVGVVFLTGMVIQPCLAGQTIKFKSKHSNIGTRWDTVEVGDQPGHVVGLFTLKGVGVRYEGPAEPPYKVDIWGTGDFRSDGTGKDSGYGKHTYSDGSYYYESWSGTMRGGRDTGTAVYFGGTGRFEGMKGGSKWDCVLLGDRGVCDIEGIIELAK